MEEEDHRLLLRQVVAHNRGTLLAVYHATRDLTPTERALRMYLDDSNPVFHLTSVGHTADVTYKTSAQITDLPSDIYINVIWHCGTPHYATMNWADIMKQLNREPMELFGHIIHAKVCTEPVSMRTRRRRRAAKRPRGGGKDEDEDEDEEEEEEEEEEARKVHRTRSNTVVAPKSKRFAPTTQAARREELELSNPTLRFVSYNPTDCDAIRFRVDSPGHVMDGFVVQSSFIGSKYKSTMSFLAFMEVQDEVGVFVFCRNDAVKEGVTIVRPRMK